jgi:hypothetical protein
MSFRSQEGRELSGQRSRDGCAATKASAGASVILCTQVITIAIAIAIAFLYCCGLASYGRATELRKVSLYDQ